ncbi:MAG: peptidase M20 [Rhodospirillum sp.]|jgi:acetylornithine deacetylase/succinyl-diaminopimelate desuccinylase-like protein|nr:peptidase M20 [Rhodospirillum sp.]
MDSTTARAFIDRLWDHEIIPNLVDYIRIPNKSPAFDPDWQTHGYMDQVVEQFAAWARAKVSSIAGGNVEVVRLEGRTPVIFIDIPGQGSDTVLLYGHLDKQPEMTGWADGLGPWVPAIKDGRLYGRGGADDGYAMFAAVAAVLALKSQGAGHARCAILIEACEESGSYDLPFYVDHLAGRLGSPSLVVCLDSGCANYDQLWLTTSLRGMIGGTLTVQVLEEGVHSGDASGVVASSFRILRTLLSRIEDEVTGEILPHAFAAQIPAGRLDEAKVAAQALGAEVYTKFPFVTGMRPMNADPVELILNRTWRPALSITGFEGAPRIQDAGNVLRPATSAKLSLRLPPTKDADTAGDALKALLEAEPPYGAKVTFELEKAGTGWDAPPLADWLRASVNKASRIAFGRDAAMMGEGGSIPFMGMLGEKYPKAQFVITGVLGPHSNAHGPNEFLHIAMGKGVTLAVSQVLVDHFARER